jgi:amino acid transporter
LRGFLIGLVLLVFLSITILSLRPGGIRSQLRFAAKRLRLALVLGGIYVVATTFVRIFFPDGPVADWGLPILAVVLVITFAVLGQNPAAEPPLNRP